MPKVHHDEPKAPEDRKPRAVEEALRRIDPCALLSAGRETVAGYGDATERDGDDLAACRLVRSHDAGSIRVRLGAFYNIAPRVGVATRTAAAGKLAYRTSRPGRCTVALPVSFDHAIVFTSSAPEQSTACAAYGFAAAAARALSAPDTPSVGRPITRWLPCDLLSAAFEHRYDQSRFRMSQTGSAAGQCSKYNGISETGPSLEVSSSASVGQEFGVLGEDHAPIRGHAVRRSSMGNSPNDDCAYAWSEPNVSTGQPATVSLYGQGCTRTETRVRRVMRTLDHERPPEHAPAHPLLYDAGESASPSVGGCVDYPPWSGDCRPYVPVDVPDDPVELIRHADADPNTNCAFALDEVRRIYGRAMQPVTTGFSLDATRPFGNRFTTGYRSAACVFLEPTHTLSVAVQAQPTAPAKSPNTGVAGHPAFDASGLRPHGARFLSVALTDAGDRGQFLAYVSTRRKKPDDAAAAAGRLDDLMRALVETHM